MEYPRFNKITVLILLISLGTTFGASIFGLNFGVLKNTAANNIEQVPKFLNRVINRHKQHSAGMSPKAFQDNREMFDNERVSFPYANINPAKYEDQQNWGLNNSTSFPNNRGNTNYNTFNPTFNPTPNKYSQKQESDANSPISFPDNLGNTDYNAYENTFNPTTNKYLQGNSFAATPSHFINKVTPGNNLNYAGSPVNIGSRGSFYGGGENSKLLPPDTAKKNPTGVYSEHTVAPDTDLTNDYSTTADYDWTTTDEPLNRIGVPGAVVASILG